MQQVCGVIVLAGTSESVCNIGRKYRTQ